MHAIKVSREKASNPYPFGYGKKGEGGETKQGVLSWNDEWCSKHTLSKGSGQETNRLVGNPRETPIRNQKWLVKS